MTTGEVRGGTFYSEAGAPALGLDDINHKHRGAGKYLVADGVHKDNDALWEYNESFIQVGDVEGDFVEVTMQGAAGGTGFFFKEGCAQNPVLAMKNSILPVVAAPDPLKILLKWEKVSGEGDFVDPSLVRAYYIPEAASELKPDFDAAPSKPTLGIVGTTQIGRASCRERV